MPAQSRLTAEISVPDIVYLPADKRATTVSVDVLCQLHNSSDDDYVTGSESIDDAHHWHVLSESHREVMRIPPTRGKRGYRRSASDVHPFVSVLVGSGHTHNASHTIKLDAKKLKPHKVYTVRYEYHGHTAEARFTTVPGHRAPAPRKKKAPARRRLRKVAGKPAKTTKGKKS